MTFSWRCIRLEDLSGLQEDSYVCNWWIGQEIHSRIGIEQEMQTLLHFPQERKLGSLAGDGASASLSGLM